MTRRRYWFASFFFFMILNFTLLPAIWVEKGIGGDPTLQNIQQQTVQGKDGPEVRSGLGSREVERPDGGKDKIYYSITTPEEESKNQREEKEKMDKSLDVLKNIIIDSQTGSRMIPQIINKKQHVETDYP